MIDITLIGSGSLSPLPDRALTAAALTCSGRIFLFDCGEGTQTAARKAGVSLAKVDVIALTHYHGDHIFGLPGLLQTMIMLERRNPLTLIGPTGLAEAISPVIKLTGELPYEVRFVELGEDGADMSGLAQGWPAGAHIQAFKTRHRVPSQGYCFTLSRAGKFQPERAKELRIPVTAWSRLQRGETVIVGGTEIAPWYVMGEPRKGLKFVFSGDTSPCDTLVKAAKGADLLICEATYGEDSQAGMALERGHSTFRMAGETASKAGVKRLWLAHYSQRITCPEEYLPIARESCPEAVCGRDGMTLTLDFEE